MLTNRTHYVAVCVGKTMRLNRGEYKTTTVPSFSCPSPSLALVYLERALPTSPDSRCFFTRHYRRYHNHCDSCCYPQLLSLPSSFLTSPISTL